jgi:hypothetical protein
MECGHGEYSEDRSSRWHLLSITRPLPKYFSVPLPMMQEDDADRVNQSVNCNCKLITVTTLIKERQHLTVCVTHKRVYKICNKITMGTYNNGCIDEIEMLPVEPKLRPRILLRNRRRAEVQQSQPISILCLSRSPLPVLIVIVMCSITLTIEGFTPTSSRRWGYRRPSAAATTPTNTGSVVLRADLTFQGDATSHIEFDAPIEHVQKWLTTPSASDLTLVGSKTASKRPNGLWDCQQPRIDFMGLNLQPYFTYNIHRQQPQTSTETATKVIVEVVDSRTEVLSRNRLNELVESLMARAKFTGKSVIQVKQGLRRTEGGHQHFCRLEIELTLRLHVPLSPFLPVPPGLNTLGSSLVKRTGSSRTEALLEDLKQSYVMWAADEDNAKQQQQ